MTYCCIEIRSGIEVEQAMPLSKPVQVIRLRLFGAVASYVFCSKTSRCRKKRFASFGSEVARGRKDGIRFSIMLIASVT
jgi:hypothetical protein